MSTPLYNPFSQLNARDFPSQRRKDVGRKLHRAKTIVKDKAHEEASEETDAELFMQAMQGRVQALGERKKNERMKNAAEKGNFVLGEDASIAQALKEAGKICPADKTDAAHVEAHLDHAPGNDVPATLTAMALAGIQVARSTEESQDLGRKAREDKDSLDFIKAIKGTRPLDSGGRDILPESVPQSVVYGGRHHPLRAFMEGKVEFSVASTDEYAEGHVVSLDFSIVAQLQTGQFSPEAHVDLHGQNCNQAFQTLVSFFRNSYYKGVRVVLVVTGRGLNSPNGVPVLRSRVLEWFTQEPFKRVVLAFCSAKQEDGGTGAFYVLLRRYKKSSGKIRWDVMPADPDLYL